MTLKNDVFNVSIYEYCAIKMNFVEADEMQTIFIIDIHSGIDTERRK